MLYKFSKTRVHLCLLGVLFLMPLFGQAQYRFHIKVRASHPVFEGKMLYLIRDDNDIANKSFIADSARIVNGLWDMKGEIQEPCKRARLRVRINNVSCESGFIIDPGFSSINLDSIEYVKYLSFKAPSTPSNELNKEINDVRTKYYNEHRKSTGNLTGPIMLPGDKSLLADLEVFDILKKKGHMYYSLIELNKISRFTSTYSKDSLILDVFYSFDDSIKRTPFGQKLLNEKLATISNRRNSQLGNTVPVFSVKTSDGSVFSNSSLLGKPYLIVFSATWCLPCIKEQPKIKALYEKYLSRNLKVVYFNLDSDRKKWLLNVKERTPYWINVSEGTKFSQSDIAKKFTVTSIPSAILVDRAGRIIYNAINIDPDFKRMDELLGKL